MLQRKESYLHVHEGRVVSNGRDNSTPPPPAPHSVRNGPDYVNDPNSLQAFQWYVSVFPAFFLLFFSLIISTRLLFIAVPTSFFLLLRFSFSFFLTFFLCCIRFGL